MRQYTSAIFVCLLCILRLTNALTLANFQLISPTAVSLGCFLEYNAPIPKCKLSDFNNGCSLSCQSALTSKASCVSNACSADNVAANTLLGIVKGGGIIVALCPNIKPSTTTTTLIKTSTASAKTTSDSVTIPTSSPGVTVSTTLSSSSSQSSSSNVFTTIFSPLPTTAESTSRESSSITSSSTSSTSFSISTSITSPTSAESMSSQSPSTNTNTDISATITTTQAPPSISSFTPTETTTSATKPKTSGAALTNNGDGITGGGSPFDIDANSGASISGVGGVSLRLVVGISLVYGVWFLG